MSAGHEVNGLIDQAPAQSCWQGKTKSLNYSNVSLSLKLSFWFIYIILSRVAHWMMWRNKYMCHFLFYLMLDSIWAFQCLSFDKSKKKLKQNQNVAWNCDFVQISSWWCDDEKDISCDTLTWRCYMWHRYRTPHRPVLWWSSFVDCIIQSCQVKNPEPCPFQLKTDCSVNLSFFNKSTKTIVDSTDLFISLSRQVE